MNDEPTELAGGDRSPAPDRSALDRSSVVRDAVGGVGTVLAIARAEQRKDRHRMTASWRQRAIVLLGAAIFLPLFGGMLRGVYGLGSRVGRGQLPELLGLATWYLPVMVGMYVFFGVLQSNSRLLHFKARDLLLTTVSNRTLVSGLLLAELGSWLLTTAGPSAVVVATFALGTGSTTTVAVGTTAVLLLAVASIVWGYVVGLAGRLLWRRLVRVNVPGALLQVLGICLLGLASGVAGIYSGDLAAKLEGDLSLSAIAPTGPPPIPFGHYAEFVFFGTPLVEGLSTAAIASGAAVLVAIPLGVTAITLVASRLWYTDPPSPDAGETDGESPDATAGSTDSRGTERDWPWLAIPSGYVADGIVRRTLRTPGRLLHLAFYVLVLSVLVATSLVDPSLLPTLLGGTFVLLGIWLAGGTFGLNPLGEEGAMLTQIVLSEYRPRTFVRARLLAGTVVGAPLVIVGTVLLTLGELSPVEAVTAGGLWLALVPVSAAIAGGIGTLLPRSEPGRVLDTERPTPETLAVVVHAGVTAVLAVIGGGFVTGALGLPVSRIGLGAVALGGLLAADLCYRFAVTGISEYGRSTRPTVTYVLELVVGISFLGLLLSITLPAGVRSVLGSSGRVASMVAVTVGTMGWVTAGGLYAVASGRRFAPGFQLPTRDNLVILVIGLLVSGAVAAGVTFTGLPHAPFPAEALALGVGGVVGTVVLHAASMEVLFRNVVQKRLEEVVSSQWSILVTAALVTAVYAPLALASGFADNAVTFAALFALAATWGWVYDRSRTVVCSTLCHACFAAALVVL